MSVSSRILSAFSGITISTVWLVAAALLEFPQAELGSGWSAIAQNFLFGFMLLPEIAVSVGSAILL